MNTQMMFARAVAGAAIAACLVGCAGSRNVEASKIVPCGGTADADSCMVFLGVDLRQIPEWNGVVTGTECGAKGCVPFQYRTKEVKLRRPFIGFESMIVYSKKKCLRRNSLEPADCEWNSDAVEGLHLEKRENSEDGKFDKAQARRWLEAAAQAVRNETGVDMKREREGDSYIALEGENHAVRLYCSVALSRIGVYEGLSDEVKESYATSYNLYINKKDINDAEPPLQVPQATEFPDKLLGVKIPKVAPPGATLLGGCIEVGGVKVRYWREDCVPLDHPLFTHSYAEYSLRTKTISGIAFGRNYPMSLSNEERKAAEDEVLKLARADGFDCDGAVNRVSADKEPGAWRFQLDAVRPDGIRLSAYVWRHPEEMRKRLGLPDECELRAVVSLPDGLLPQIRTSRLWREGQEEPSTEESK